MYTAKSNTSFFPRSHKTKNVHYIFLVAKSNTFFLSPKQDWMHNDSTSFNHLIRSNLIYLQAQMWYWLKTWALHFRLFVCVHECNLSAWYLLIFEIMGFCCVESVLFYSFFPTRPAAYVSDYSEAEENRTWRN